MGSVARKAANMSVSGLKYFEICNAGPSLSRRVLRGGKYIRFARASNAVTEPSFSGNCPDLVFYAIYPISARGKVREIPQPDDYSRVASDA